MAARRRRLQRIVVGLACALASRSPRLAFAGEPGTRPIADAIDLAPSSCLEKKALADQVQMWLGRDRLDERLSISVADAPSGVRFVVKREGEILGERTLNVLHVPCQEIHAAVGLGVASAIDATVLTSLGVSPPLPPPPVAAPAPLPEPVPETPRPPVVVPPLAWVPPPGLSPGFGPLPPEKPKRAYPAFTISLAGMVLIDVLPKVTPGVAPSAELSVVKGFDLRASALATGTTTVEVGGGTADAALVAGRLDACAVLVLLDDIARLRACGGLVAGGVNASGAGFQQPQSKVGPWIAPTVRGDARWSLTKNFGLIFGVEGFFPGLKPELQATGPDGKVKAPAVTFPLAGVGLSIGPSVTF